MQYRTLGKTGIQVSQIGLGGEHLEGKPYEVTKAVVDEALAQGVNIFDLFMSNPQIRDDFGRALEGRRDKVIIQGHIGATWQNGQYTRSRDLQQCRFFFEDLLTRLRTDYLDIGMIHYVDSQADYDSVFASPIIEYVQELKKQGRIRMIGLSSHDPVIAKKAVETGLIDVLMFSVNPAYDMIPGGTTIENLNTPDALHRDGFGAIHPDRSALYATCERLGTAITVMKTFANTRLLDPAKSAFGTSLNRYQLMHYALTRPAVSSLLIGFTAPEQIGDLLRYDGMSDEERDFSVIFTQAPHFSQKGLCVYCNHCLPCPSNINIAQVNQFLDLATAADHVPATVAEHYAALSAHGSDCIACGSCEGNCPFGVPVIERMEKAAALFGV